MKVLVLKYSAIIPDSFGRLRVTVASVLATAGTTKSHVDTFTNYQERPGPKRVESRNVPSVDRGLCDSIP
jgi:hypothetical protein